MGGIVERLRCHYGGRDFSGPAPEGTMLPTPLMLESAAEIERFQREVTRLSSQVDFYASRAACKDDCARVQSCLAEVDRVKEENRLLREKLSQWEALKDSSNLHANILLGDVISLTKEQAMHIAGVNSEE